MTLDPKYIPGHALLSRAIALCRRPLFLSRNLAEAIAWMKDEAIDDPKQRLLRETWNPPSHAVIDAITTRQGQKMRIEVKSLKPLHSQSGADEHEPSGSTRKKCKVLEAECRINLSISAMEGSQMNPILLASRECKLSGRKYQDDAVKFDVSMKQPLIINLSELEVTIHRGDTWERNLAKAYHMSLSLLFASPEDAALVMPLVGSGNPRAADSGDECLVATWSKLPECPWLGSVLPAHSGREAGPKTKYGFELDMAWLNQPESTLQVYNRLRRSQRTEHGESAIPRHQKLHQGPQSAVMKYHYKENVLIWHSLACPICDKKLKALDILLHHLENSHLAVLAIKESPTSVDVTIQAMGLKDDPGWKDEPLSWIVPSRAKLKEEYWTKRSTERKPTTTKSTNTARRNEGRVRSIPRKPKEVEIDQDWPKKRRFAVPQSLTDLRDPGRTLRFFSSTAQRPLEEGDLLSETDDETDMDFKLRAVPSEMRRCEAAGPKTNVEGLANFANAWNKHVDDEHCQADLHAGDMVLRFVTKNQELLSVEANRRPMEHTLKDLHEDSVITSEIFEHCMSLIPKKESPFKSRCFPGEEKEEEEEKPKTSGRNQCACGKSRSHNDPEIWIDCDNDDCDKPHHHLRCAGLKEWIRGWRCVQCAR